MEKLKVKNIYSGRPDARDELDFDSYEKFEKCFVMPPNLDINEIIEGNNCFIRGYKGTGKTALMYYIKNQIIKSDHLSAISFIYFKEIDTADKNKLEDIAKKIDFTKEYDISISNNILLKVDGYVYIWKWIILMQIFLDNEEYNEGLFIKNEYYDRFIKLIKIIQFDRLNKRKITIPSEIKVSCNIDIEPYKTTLKPSFKIDFKSKENTKGYNTFREIIDDAMDCLAKMTRSDIPYYIMFDELEAFYSEEGLFKRDLCLLRDLIVTVKEINRIFIQNYKKTKIICCIRTELLNSIYKYIPSREINKVTNGFECPVVWNYNNTNSYKHPIFQILIKRIQYSEREAGNDLSDFDIYNKWFDEFINEVPVVDFFLNQTWSKPRDVVRFLIASHNCLSSDSYKFDNAVFLDSMEEYSRESLKEVKEELNAIYSNKEIEEIILWFKGYKTYFSLEDLQNRIDITFKYSIISEPLVNVLTNLYRVGFVGNYSKITKNYLWQHRGNDDPIFSSEWIFCINRGLYKALSINSKANFKKMEKRLELSKIYEGQVTQINDKSIKLKIRDNNNDYFGLIYISELENFFITKEYLYKKFHINDKITVKVIGYDKNYNINLLSKKQANATQTFKNTPFEDLLYKK